MSDHHDRTDRDGHPDVEGLLKRNAARPGAGLEPAEITRRARRRTRVTRAAGAGAAVAVLAAAVLGIAALLPREEVVFGSGGEPSPGEPGERGEPGEPGEVVATASPSPGEGVATPSPTEASPDPTPTGAEPTHESGEDPPARWVGVRASGEEFEVVRHADGESHVLARQPRTSPEAGDARVTDLAVGREVSEVLLGLCCEPVSGRVLRARLDDDGRDTLEEAGIQGFRLDLAPGGTLFARTDTFGVLEILPAYPDLDGRLLDDGASAADVAVERGPRGRVAVLVDPELASLPVPEGDGQRSLRLYRRDDGGSWTTDEVPLDEPVCALVFLAGERLGLLRPDGAAEDVLDCTGTRVDVLDLATGDLGDPLRFPEPVVHLGVDETGEYLLATVAGGAVHWAGIDDPDRRGTLAGEGYVAAGW